MNVKDQRMLIFVDKQKTVKKNEQNKTKKQQTSNIKLLKLEKHSKRKKVSVACYNL